MKTLILAAVLVICCMHCATVDAQCTDPALKIAPTLDENGTKLKPKKLNKLLKKKYKTTKTMLGEVGKNVDLIISSQTDAEKYPSCNYAKQCPFKLRKIDRWQVVGTDCWLIEPLAWAECSDAGDASSECADGTAGYTCRQVYTNMNVWVYCNAKKDPIKQMMVAVSTGCEAMMYECKNS